MPNRSYDSASGVPTSIQPAIESCRAHPQLCCPFENALGFPVKSKGMFASSVARLLLDSCPAAVRGGIQPVVVDPFQCVRSGWLSAHVCEEVLKTIPAFADSYAAPSVVAVVMRPRISASVAHGCPCYIFRRVGSPMRFTVSSPERTDALADGASARACISRPKGRLVNQRGAPAGAAAIPAPSSCAATATLVDSGEASKLLFF
jgi:hypothetical protein